MSIRLAIGAGRGRLVRQFLTESLVLALLGGALGLVIATWFSARLFAMFVGDRGIVLSLRPDWRVLVFTGGIALIACVVAGLAPALRAVRVHVNPGLKQVRVRGHGPRRKSDGGRSVGDLDGAIGRIFSLHWHAREAVSCRARIPESDGCARAECVECDAIRTPTRAGDAACAARGAKAATRCEIRERRASTAGRRWALGSQRACRRLRRATRRAERRVQRDRARLFLDAEDADRVRKRVH